MASVPHFYKNSPKLVNRTLHRLIQLVVVEGTGSPNVFFVFRPPKGQILPILRILLCLPHYYAGCILAKA